MKSEGISCFSSYSINFYSITCSIDFISFIFFSSLGLPQNECVFYYIAVSHIYYCVLGVDSLGQSDGGIKIKFCCHSLKSNDVGSNTCSLTC